MFKVAPESNCGTIRGFFPSGGLLQRFSPVSLRRLTYARLLPDYGMSGSIVFQSCSLFLGESKRYGFPLSPRYQHIHVVCRT
jgi:hypothetical protein